LIASVCHGHVSSLSQNTQFEFHLINKILTANGNTLGPFIILVISVI
jgi:hypothetical protein